MSYLANQRQLQALRSALLAHIVQQRDSVRSRADGAAEHLASRQDSRAQQAAERDLELALSAHELAELAALDAALARIADGSYGLCADCASHIPPPRLHASPETSRCIDCQTAFERHAA